jgi:outer membrane protein
MKKCILMLAVCYGPIVSQAQVTTARIGYVDIDYIITRLPETKAGQAELASLHQRYENQLNEKVRAFQRVLESTPHGSISDAALSAFEKELKESQRDIEESQEEALSILEQKKTELAVAALAKVQRAVVTVAQAEGFDLMLRAQHVVYGDVAFNITFTVLSTLGVVLAEADKQQYKRARSNPAFEHYFPPVDRR